MENFEDVKVGDMVIIHNRYGNDVCEVERVTTTLFVAGRQKFRKSDGIMSGKYGFYKPYATKATPELIEKTKKEKIMFKYLREVNSFHDWDKLSFDELEQVSNVIRNYRV